MKKLLVGLVMLSALSAHADGWHRHSGGFGLLPFIVGGVIGYEVGEDNESRHNEPQYQQPVPQRGVLIDGVVYVEVLQYDQNCNCYKKILVPRQ